MFHQYSMIYLSRDNQIRQNLISVGELRNMNLGRRQPVHGLHSFSFLGPWWGYSTSKRSEVYSAGWRRTWNHLVSQVLKRKYSSALTFTGQKSERPVASSRLPSPPKLGTNVTDSWISPGQKRISSCSLRKAKCYFSLERNCSTGLSTIYP